MRKTVVTDMRMLREKLINIREKREVIEDIIEHLRELADGTVQPSNTDHGLCIQLRRMNIGVGCMSIMMKWPEYSGNRFYPIKGTDYRSPHFLYTNTRNLWDFSTKYGQARSRLCDYMADYFEDHMEELLE